MKKRIKKKWIAALRSGEYEQGRYRLRDGDKYCCLGVLCDLHARETNRRWRCNTYCGMGGTLPDVVQAWAGLDTHDPQLTVCESNHQLRHEKAAIRVRLQASTINDVNQFSFSKIADLIEKYL